MVEKGPSHLVTALQTTTAQVEGIFRKIVKRNKRLEN